jgi:hypothetical protein
MDRERGNWVGERSALPVLFGAYTTARPGTSVCDTTRAANHKGRRQWTKIRSELPYDRLVRWCLGGERFCRATSAAMFIICHIMFMPCYTTSWRNAA